MKVYITGHYMRIFFLLCWIQCVALTANIQTNDSEQAFIEHVLSSIEKAEAHSSRLSEEVLNLDGMSSPKVRHFLNNLCSLPNATYLEVGCYRGSAWLASLFDNEDTMYFAYAVDDWSEFWYHRKDFENNCIRLLKKKNYQLFSCNPFRVNLHPLRKKPINIFFYDGNHTELDQEQAFTYYNEVLADTFIAVIDDWNYLEVQNGTRNAFEKLNYEILFEQSLPSNHYLDKENWWNGLYVAVIRKSI